MILGKCIMCHKVREIVFEDYCTRAIKVCFDCAEFSAPIFDDVLKLYEKEIRVMIICSQCRNRFFQRKTNQVICTNCWIENKNSKQIIVVPVSYIKETKLEVLPCLK